jgi:hypothetical protein
VGCPVALRFLGEALDLAFVYVAYPFPARLGRWAHPRVVGSTTVSQGLDVCAIQFGPCAYLIGSADGPVAGDDDADIVGHTFKQL